MTKWIQKFARCTSGKLGAVFLLIQILVPFTVAAQGASFTNLITQGRAFAKAGDVKKALETYVQAETIKSNSAPDLCLLTHHICDLMYQTQSANLQKSLAEHALSAAKLAVQAGPKNATAHICLAIASAKNFPFVDTRTKVRYSRQIKVESDQAIALDPKQDLGYYLLGRWNHGVAGMNVIERGLVKVIYGGLPQASDRAAIQNLKKAVELAPKRIITHAELAKIYRATGQKELAQEELKTCVALTPMDRDDRDAQADAAKELKTSN